MNRILILATIILLTGCTNTQIVSNTEKPIEPQPQLNKNTEQSFDEAKPIEWVGKVITYMVSNSAYAFETIGDNPDHEMFYAHPIPVTITEKSTRTPMYEKGTIIKVKGDWLGITCGYQSSIFRGNCVPDINVTSTEIVEKNNPDGEINE